MFEDTIVEGMQSPTKVSSPMKTNRNNEAPPPPPPPPPPGPGPPEPEPEEPEPEAERDSPNQRNDALHSEFLYYTTLFKPLSGALTRNSDKTELFAWVNKLFGPEYHADAFKEKRNRYLCSLCLSMMNDELTGLFSRPPPPGALPHWLDVEVDEFPLAAWETDTMWDETISGIGGADPVGDVPCNFHDEEGDSNEACPEVSPNTNRMLDDEFAFYLYLCRPYAAMMPSADEKTKVAVWLQSLQMISRNACPTMKGMRNDYIQALLGCVYDLRTAGPFLDYPPVTRLYPLTEAARLAAHTHPGINERMSREADDFLSEESFPKEGAFCYIAVTGDVQETSIPGLLKQTKRPKTPPRTSLPLTLKNAYAPRSDKNKSKQKDKTTYELEELYKKDRRSI